ncbi:putative plastid-lipid-associated protein 10, chloroplastic [Trifolium repens]|nr:putative plastid-lipid-associated protein 10, chloroplastic [Trifolium repens]
MELAFNSSSPLLCKRHTPSSSNVVNRRRKLLSVSMAMPSAAQVYDSELENKKHELLTSVRDTQRGLLTTPLQRSSIEEALVNVEGRNLGHPIDLNKLDGTWRLQYTSASDVLILFQAAATLPFFQVGQIFQKFECRHNSNGGVIRNIVQWSIPNLLEVKHHISFTFSFLTYLLTWLQLTSYL